MFIQCQHCQTTYKIDEHKIPDKESVVRCSNCSELIPLNQEKQKELLKKSPKKIVECDSCGTQYSVPLSTIKQESTKARCGKCGNFFTITRSKHDTPTDGPSSAHAYEEEVDDDLNLDSIDIPAENEIEIDDLFDDVNAMEKGTPQHSSQSKNATDEYLESVKLTDDDDEEDIEIDDDLGIGGIAQDHKYKIFLKPGKKEPSAESWSGSGDEAEEEIADLTPATKAGKKAKKPKKAATKKRNILLWFIWLAVILVLATLAWVVMDFQTKEIYSPPQTETYDNQSKIAILEPLNGKFLKNNQFPDRMFVLEGKLLNIYGADVTLSKIEIEGYLHTLESEEPITATSFAGVILTEKQLREWDKIEIETALMSQSQDSSSLREFSADELIDFQVVFFNAPDSQEITKLGAKIRKFNRRK